MELLSLEKNTKQNTPHAVYQQQEHGNISDKGCALALRFMGKSPFRVFPFSVEGSENSVVIDRVLEGDHATGLHVGTPPRDACRGQVK